MNALMTLISSPQAAHLNLVLLHFLWQGVVVAVLAGIGLLVLRKASPNARYALLLVALGLMVLAPVATYFALPGAEKLVVASSFSAVSAPAPVFWTPVASTVTTKVAVPKVSLRTRLLARLDWLVAIWVAGVSVLSFRLLLGWLGLGFLRRRAKRVGEELSTRATALAARMRVTKTVALLESAKVHAPALVGWLRPAILLPSAALVGLTPEQLEAVLAHELAHLRRHDYLVNLGQTLIETVLFYHPAVWWVSKRLRHERECCCDDIAAQVCGDVTVYVRALATLRQVCAGGAQLAPAATGGEVVGRVRRLLRLPEPRSSRSPLMAAVLALSLVAAVLCAVHLSKPAVAAEQKAVAKRMIAQVAQAMGRYSPSSGTDTVVMKPVWTEAVTGERNEAAAGLLIKLTVHELVIAKKEAEAKGIFWLSDANGYGVSTDYASKYGDLVKRTAAAPSEVTMPNLTKATITLPAFDWVGEAKLDVTPRINANGTLTLALSLRQTSAASAPTLVTASNFDTTLNVSLGEALVIGGANNGDKETLFLVQPEFVGTPEQMEKAKALAEVEQQQAQQRAALKEQQKQAATAAEREALQKQLADLDRQRAQLIEQLNRLNVNAPGPAAPNEATRMFKLEFMDPQLLVYQLGLSDDPGPNYQGGSRGGSAPARGNLGSFLPEGVSQVVAFPMLHSLLVRGTQEGLDKFAEFLKLTDHKPQQVMIEVRSYQGVLTNGKEFAKTGPLPVAAPNGVDMLFLGKSEPAFDVPNPKITDALRFATMNLMECTNSVQTTLPGNKVVGNTISMIPRTNGDGTITLTMKAQLTSTDGAISFTTTLNVPDGQAFAVLLKGQRVTIVVRPQVIKQEATTTRGVI